MSKIINVSTMKVFDYVDKKTKDTVVEENNFELQKILDKNVSTKKSKTSTNTGNNSLEESILKKINVN